MRAAGLLSLLLALPAPLTGQAWLSPKGEGTVSALYQNDIERLHTFSDGRTLDKGHTYFDTMVVNTDFSLTDSFAISVSLPYVAGKYTGLAPHLLVRGQRSTAVALDNGDFHSRPQDFRLNLRYAL